MFTTFSSFLQVFDQVTKYYSRLIINCTVQSNKFLDKVQWRKSVKTVITKHLISNEICLLNKELQLNESKDDALKQKLKYVNEAIEKLVLVINNIKLMLAKK